MRLTADFKHAATVLCMAAVLATLALTGCKSYRAGSVMHPQISSIAVGEFHNRTDEPALAIQLRQKLAEQFMRDGSVALKSEADADVVIVGIIREYEMERAAAAKLRDEDALPDDRSTYRTTVYRARVTVEYRLLVAGNQRRLLIPPQLVAGIANFPEMPDLNMTRQSGLQQALHDAAQQIVASITEAW